MPSAIDPTNRRSHDTELVVHGELPHGLSGRLTAIGGDGVVHVVRIHAGRATYRTRRIRAAAVRELVVFEGSVLVLAEDSSVHVLGAGGDTPRRVDLAGLHRDVAVGPILDPTTGELHLVVRDPDGAGAHVVVAAGAQTRRGRPIVDAPSRIEGLALGSDHVVLVADGVVGVASRVGELRPTWISTDLTAVRPISVHLVGDTVVLLALTPALERLTLHPQSRRFERAVIDPAARLFARSGGDIGGPHHAVWTTGGDTIARHDQADSSTTRLRLEQQGTGDFVLVNLPGHANVTNGWFVGVVHDVSGDAADLVVIDAGDLASGALATIHLGRRVPAGLRLAWLASTAHAPETTTPKEIEP